MAKPPVQEQPSGSLSKVRSTSPWEPGKGDGEVTNQEGIDTLIQGTVPPIGIFAAALSHS